MFGIYEGSLLAQGRLSFFDRGFYPEEKRETPKVLPRKILPIDEQLTMASADEDFAPVELDFYNWLLRISTANSLKVLDEEFSLMLVENPEYSENKGIIQNYYFYRYQIIPNVIENILNNYNFDESLNAYSIPDEKYLEIDEIIARAVSQKIVEMQIYTTHL